MKTMCPFGYHRNGFMVVHALGYIKDGCNEDHLQVHELPRSHCGDNRESNIH